jgi:integrase
MPKVSKALTPLELRRATEPGLHFAGEGLYLQVTGANARSWLFRYSLAGKPRMMGLGSERHLSLADARKLRDEARALWLRGLDPLEARKRDQARLRIENTKATTFREVAEQYISARQIGEAGWRNAKHAAQWASTLKSFAYPMFGDLPVQVVDRSLVIKTLDPIWSTKHETARRLRGRIETILDFAQARGFRPDDAANPARREALKAAFPQFKRSVKHHSALKYQEVGAFMADLRNREGSAARALEFAILTAARTGEVLGAKWAEIDEAARVWVVPGNRMKSGREHRVPLSDAALQVLDGMKQNPRESDLVFPSVGKKGPMSNMAMLKLLQRMGRPEITVHGFRSTFRDWAAEETEFRNEVLEMALAHSVGDDVEAAYRRGDMFQKRRAPMDAWADFCGRVVASASL